jgi:hypothetical protein
MFFAGIISTWIFVDPPHFRIPTIINLSFSIAIAALSAVLSAYVTWANLQKRKTILRLIESADNNKSSAEWDSKENRVLLGDRHPRFEYTP